MTLGGDDEKVTLGWLDEEKDPKPACQQGQSEATWSCSSERWEHGTVTADACHANPQNTIGYIYDEWRSTSCDYDSRAVRAPSCNGTLEWYQCKWDLPCRSTQYSIQLPLLNFPSNFAGGHRAEFGSGVQQRWKHHASGDIGRAEQHHENLAGQLGYRRRCGGSLIGGPIPLDRKQRGAMHWLFQLGSVFRIDRRGVWRGGCGPSNG